MGLRVAEQVSGLAPNPQKVARGPCQRGSAMNTNQTPAVLGKRIANARTPRNQPPNPACNCHCNSMIIFLAFHGRAAPCASCPPAMFLHHCTSGHALRSNALNGSLTAFVTAMHAKTKTNVTVALQEGGLKAVCISGLVGPPPGTGGFSVDSHRSRATGGRSRARTWLTHDGCMAHV